jgi:DNA-binding NtrC family response regulator
LLRVLQSNEIERIGGTAPIPINVRFLCSTNRDLQQMIREGAFRADLFYRIHTMEIPVPPLRERPEDIPALTKHFIEKANLRNDLTVTGLTPKDRDLLIAHTWPGNVRELEHAVERACVLCGDGNLAPEHFSLAVVKPASHVKHAALDSAPLWDKTSSLEQQAILDALEACQGNKRAAADMLKITRATLYSKLKKYNIQF